MKPTLSKSFSNMNAEEKAALDTKAGKSIVGHSRIQHPGQPAINFFILEDGTEAIETDDGKKTKWPGSE